MPTTWLLAGLMLSGNAAQQTKADDELPWELASQREPRHTHIRVSSKVAPKSNARFSLFNERFPSYT